MRLLQLSASTSTPSFPVACDLEVLLSRSLVIPIAPLQLLLVAQSAGANQPGSVKQFSFDIERRASIAKNLTTHTAVVSSTVHRESFLAAITYFAKSVRHPEFILLWLNGFFLFDRFSFHYILSFRIDQNRQKVLFHVSWRREL